MGGCDVISVQRVDPDRVTKYGYTALEISAINGRTEIVRLLVREHGANVNKMNDNNQFTPLENAIEGGHMDTVRMMIEELRAQFRGTEVTDLQSAAAVVVSQGESHSSSRMMVKLFKSPAIGYLFFFLINC